MHIFNRVIQNSSIDLAPPYAMDSRHPTAEVLMVSGLTEAGLAMHGVVYTEAVHRAGHRATHALGFRGHEHQEEDYEFIARWLHESWATSDSGARPKPQTVTDSLPTLTADILTRMTSFWDRFRQMPDSILTTARRAYLREVALPAWDVPLSTMMVDMPAMAAQYPSVAAELTRASLTAEQHEAYRLALASARLISEGRQQDPKWTPARAFEIVDESLAAHPVLRHNVRFFQDHPDELAQLAATGIWKTP